MQVEINVSLDYETYQDIRARIREYLYTKIPPFVVKNQHRLRKEMVEGVKIFASKLPVYRKYVFYSEGAVDGHAKWVPNRGYYAIWKAIHYPFAKILELTGTLRESFAQVRVTSTRSLDAVVKVESKIPTYWKIHEFGNEFVPKRDFTFLSKTMRLVLAYDLLEASRGWFKQLISKYANYFFRFYVKNNRNEEPPDLLALP